MDSSTLATFGLPNGVVDPKVVESNAAQLRKAGIRLPTLAELARPEHIPADVAGTLEQVDPDAAHWANLFRVHWYNDSTRRGRDSTPGYLVLPPELTRTAAPIIVILGRRFPMIGAHKVLAAYSCLAPRLAAGLFDMSEHRAVWPSTGNYCRGGIAISRILGCHGVAVLPEGMSAERFEWLSRWVSHPDDIVRTVGSESNVKEIYDKCAELANDPRNAIINQFSEFGNYLGHYACTGPAVEAVYRACAQASPGLKVSAYVAGTGSAGTLGAGDYLKERYGTHIAAVEALECPTMLYNGYGEHNIQGMGDKHIPLIHNVMNTDAVIAVSDAASDQLDVLFNTQVGRHYLTERHGIEPTVVEALGSLGLSGIANVKAAIKLARRLDFGPEDAVVTVATDGAELYGSEREKTLSRDFPRGFDAVSAGEVFGCHIAASDSDHVVQLDHRERRRVFNLGYYTWVEQQGIELEHFDARRDQAFWRGLRDLLPAWDTMVAELNAKAGTS